MCVGTCMYMYNTYQKKIDNGKNKRLDENLFKNSVERPARASEYKFG